jgi:nucleotide-binding universal stress UspA family protein
MVNLHRILVATDFSDSSKEALDHAIFLAKPLKADIYLLHAFEPHYYHQDVMRRMGPEVHEWMDRIKEGERKRLADLEKEVGKSKVKIRTIFKEGKAFREILKVADEISADLIVLGTHGRTGLDHLMLGSVAERVARMAPCPVFIVREKTGKSEKKKTT